MTLCAAVHCKNVGIHLFPKDVTRRKQWEKALGRRNFKASKHSRLCGSHFKPEDYSTINGYTNDDNLRKCLKKTAVPSIFTITKAIPVDPLGEDDITSRLRKRNRKRRISDTLCTDPGLSNVQTLDNSDDDQFTVHGEREVFITTPSEPEISQKGVSKSTQVNLGTIYGSIQKHKDNNSVIAYYTGFETYEKFHFVFSTLNLMAEQKKFYGNYGLISAEDQFFMTMMKLRQNKCNFELAQFFAATQPTVLNIYVTWIIYMEQVWSKLNIWPDKELLHEYMPEHFKKHVINTMVNGAQGNEGMDQIPGSNSPEDGECGLQPVHIKRMNGLTKTYKILKDDLQNNLVPLASKIFFVCFMCCNFRECVS